MKIYGDYESGYKRAFGIDPELANNYVAHAFIGDPPADALSGALSHLPRTEGYRHKETRMNRGAAALDDAPRAVQEFFEAKDEKERKPLLKLALSVSRALIGNERANHLKYPKYCTWGLLEAVRLRTRFDTIENAMLKKHRQMTRFTHFKYLMNASIYDKGGISFRLPDHVHSKDPTDGEERPATATD